MNPRRPSIPKPPWELGGRSHRASGSPRGRVARSQHARTTSIPLTASQRVILVPKFSDPSLLIDDDAPYIKSEPEDDEVLLSDHEHPKTPPVHTTPEHCTTRSPKINDEPPPEATPEAATPQAPPNRLRFSHPPETPASKRIKGDTIVHDGSPLAIQRPLPPTPYSAVISPAVHQSIARLGDGEKRGRVLAVQNLGRSRRTTRPADHSFRNTDPAAFGVNGRRCTWRRGTPYTG